MMFEQLKRMEKGQSLVTVLVMMVAIIAMLALVLDGGSAYLHRRQAQNAADAGALAGITKLCGSALESADYNDAYNLAWEYAVTRNRSEPDYSKTIITFPTTPEIDIQVEAQVDFPIFFARIFSTESELPARAVAAAECEAVTVGEGVLPIAYPCDPPPEGDESDSTDCGVVYGEPNPADEADGFVNPGDTNWDEMVIAMSSEEDIYQCYDPDTNPLGPIDCDVDDDGIRDIYDSDNRGWLNLNGGPILSEELADWIINGYYDVPIHPYTWVGHRPGTNQDLFETTRIREGDNVLVPIYDKLCDNWNGEPSELSVPSVMCPADFSDGNPNPPDYEIGSEGGDHGYYRIVGWGLFHVVCIYADGPKDKEHPPRCPFRLTSQEQGGAGLPKELDNKTIEGYFLSGAHQGSSSGGGVDMGVYWFWLSR
jgi:hypothetical protein